MKSGNHFSHLFECKTSIGECRIIRILNNLYSVKSTYRPSHLLGIISAHHPKAQIVCGRSSFVSFDESGEVKGSKQHNRKEKS
jgi:hypothetical protein